MTYKENMKTLDMRTEYKGGKAMLLGCLAYALTCTVDVRANDLFPLTTPPLVLSTSQGKEEDINLKLAFDLLSKNRKEYNAYNDSIFFFHNPDDWRNFFIRRSVKNHQLFAANQQILKEIKTYFSKRNPRPSEEKYKELFYYNEKTTNNNLNDRFVTLEICNILKEYYESGECPDSLNFILETKLQEGYTYHYMARLIPNDTIYYKKAFNVFNEVLNCKNTNLRHYKFSQFIAHVDLLATLWIQKKLMTPKEGEVHKAALQKLLADSTFHDLTPKLRQNAYIMVNNYTESIIRNVYLNDTTVLDKQQADSIINKIIARNRVTSDLSLTSYYRTLILQVVMKQKDALVAWKEAQSTYHILRKNLSQSRLTDIELSRYLATFFSLLYLNDLADMPEKEKRENVLQYCEDIIDAYSRRDDQQQRNGYIAQLYRLTTYDRLLKFLTTQERIRFLETLNVSTQVSTYAHTVHVAKLAEVLMKGIIKYNPKLLIGNLGIKSVHEVKQRKGEILNYIYHAALYHDLGKNCITSIVNNDFRPLTDEEFSLIKLHPELGLRFLAIDPSLAIYHDTTLGHHKWYNGKGGYPAWFDNTKSPVRTMIDIVTFCDCMQAATERLGRNYKKEKTFEMLMEEFRHDAGVRYNPDLVKLVDAHSSVKKALSELVSDGWLDVYFEIYQNFIKDNLSSAPK